MLSSVWRHRRRCRQTPLPPRHPIILWRWLQTHSLPLSACHDLWFRARVCLRAYVCERARTAFQRALAGLADLMHVRGMNARPWASRLTCWLDWVAWPKGREKVMAVKSWPTPWEICDGSLSERKNKLSSRKNAFSSWSSPRCGGELSGEGERGGGVGVGTWGRLVLVACVSVMNRTLKQEQTQFQAQSPRGEALGPSTRHHSQTKVLTSSLPHRFVLEPCFKSVSI